MTDSSDCTAPAGLPGRFRMIEFPRTPQTARLRAANGVFFAPSARMRSAMPSRVRSQTVRVASGVISRGAIPVPPVVTTSGTRAVQERRACSMAGCSSGTVAVPASANLCFLRTSATAGPERSLRSPREQESLTVMTAARRGSGVEEDVIFFFLGSFAALALRFVELAEAFHQQALSVQGGGLFVGLAFEIDLEVAVGPAQNFEDGLVAVQGTVGSVRDLAFLEEHFTFFVFAGEGEGAAFAAHLEGLDQVDHIHLQEAAAEDAIGRSGLGHLLEGDFVDDAFDALGGFAQEEWFFNEVVDGKVGGGQFCCDIGFGGEQDDGGCGSAGTAAEFL